MRRRASASSRGSHGSTVWVEKDASIGALTVEGEVERLTIRDANVIHGAAHPPTGCLISTEGKDGRGRIRHLQLQNTTARGLKEIVRRREGDVGHVDADNVITD